MSDDLRKLATAICNEEGLGISSKTIVAYCTGVDYFRADRPHDADDVSRCINVLSFFPEWKEKIKHISDRFPCWGSIGKNWQAIEDFYNEKDWAIVVELLDLFSRCKGGDK